MFCKTIRNIGESLIYTLFQEIIIFMYPNPYKLAWEKAILQDFWNSLYISKRNHVKYRNFIFSYIISGSLSENIGCQRTIHVQLTAGVLRQPSDLFPFAQSYGHSVQSVAAAMIASTADNSHTAFLHSGSAFIFSRFDFSKCRYKVMAP